MKHIRQDRNEAGARFDPSRLAVLVLAGALAAGCNPNVIDGPDRGSTRSGSDTGSTTSSSTEPSNEPTLASAGAAVGLRWGASVNAYGDNTNLVDQDYMSLLSREFGVLNTSNTSMAEILPVPDEYHLYDSYTGWSTPTDAIVGFGEAHDMKILFHPLIMGVWEGVQPGGNDWATPQWIHDTPLSPAQLTAIMNDYIDEVLSYGKGRVDAYVVVNEPVGWGPDAEPVVKPCVWSNKLGDDYVELAFERARLADPDAVLILNEFGADFPGSSPDDPNRADRFYAYVAQLVGKGVPIDAVGLEFHLAVGTNDPSVAELVAHFERFGQLGLALFITELTVRIPAPVSAQGLQAQAQIYATVVQACIESHSCKGISVWDGADRYSWINQSNPFPGYADPCLFDADLQPKPAYHAVMEVMAKAAGG